MKEFYRTRDRIPGLSGLSSTDTAGSSTKVPRNIAGSTRHRSSPDRNVGLLAERFEDAFYPAASRRHEPGDFTRPTTLARQVMESGGAGKDEAWYQRTRENRSEKQVVAIPNPVPISVVPGKSE